MKLDRNMTTWQRLNAELSKYFADKYEVDNLTQSLHEYILSERRDAVRAYEARMASIARSVFNPGVDRDS